MLLPLDIPLIPASFPVFAYPSCLPKLSANSYCDSLMIILTIAGIIVATWKLLHVAVGIWTKSSGVDDIRLRIRI